MTTGAMVFGDPLLFASAGAASRFGLGLVIVSGMLVGVVHPVCAADGVYAAGARSRGGVAPASWLPRKGADGINRRRPDEK